MTRRSPPDETLLQSLSPLARIQNASRQVQGDPLDQYVILFRAERQRTESLKDELEKAKDLNERLTAWGRRLRKITKDSRAKTIDAEARLRRLIVGMNNAQMVSKERVRIRALEKNLEAVARKYSMEKELHKEVTRMYSKAKESHEEMRLRFVGYICLLYTSPSPRDQRGSRMPSSA